MKPIKMLGLAALAALMAMAFVGASSAMAETTRLCAVDPVPSDASTPTCSPISHVHETSVGKAKLLSSINVECDVLFLGDTLGEKGSPLVIHGKFTYTECGSCEVEEKNGPAEIKVLVESHETGAVTGEGLVFVECSGFISCSYNGVGLKGTAKGPLLSTQANGEVTIKEQKTNKETGGFLCPKEAKLDITTTPLSATYIVPEPLTFCVETEHITGLYDDSECKGKSKVAHTGVYTLVWAWKGWGLVGDKRCYDTLSHEGLWKTYRLSGLGCLDDGTLYAELYENGIIRLIED